MKPDFRRIPSQPEQLSRRDRRMAERKRQEYKSKKGGPTVDRRIFIGGGLALAAGAIGLSIFEANNHTHGTEGPATIEFPTPTATVDGDAIGQASQTIKTYFDTNGRHHDQAKIDVLNQLYSPIENLTPIPDDQIHNAETVVQNRIRSVIGPMANSGLSLFEDTAHFYLDNSPSGTIVIQTDATLDSDGENAYMSTGPAINKDTDKVEIVVHVDTRDVIKSSNGFRLAVSLIHEKRHAKTRVDLLKQHSNLNPKDQMVLLNQYTHDHRLEDECAAYADEAQAILDALGTGFQSQLPGHMIELAAKYIECKLNPTNQNWVNYIQQIISA